MIVGIRPTMNNYGAKYFTETTRHDSRCCGAIGKRARAAAVCEPMPATPDDLVDLQRRPEYLACQLHHYVAPGAADRESDCWFSAPSGPARHDFAAGFVRAAFAADEALLFQAVEGVIHCRAMRAS